MIPFIHIGQTCSFRYWLSCILQWDEPRSELNVDGLRSEKRLIAPVLQGKRTCQRTQLLQFSVCTEGEGGSAEPLLPLHSRVGARLLHPHQLSRRRRFLTGALQETRVTQEGFPLLQERAGPGSASDGGDGEAITLLASSRVSAESARGQERKAGEARQGKARQGKARS